MTARSIQSDAGRRTEPFVCRCVLAVALLGLAAGAGAPLLGDLAAEQRLIWAAATLPVLVALAVSIVRDLLRGRFRVDAIALLAMSAALLLGETLVAIVVAIIYAGGTLLEDFACRHAERNLSAIVRRSPRHAHRRHGDAIDTIPAEAVAAGDELLVRPSELVPVDGTLLDRNALIDESSVTGEPLRQTLLAGDTLRSGTANAGEAFAMRAAATASASTYAGILRMVAAAQSSRLPYICTADRVALLILPATLAVAALAWYASASPIRALAVLTVAAPCPLVLAAPLAFLGGISRAAGAGIIIRGSASLQSLPAVRTAAFDKTGILTLGGAELIETDPAPGADPHELLRLLASLEQASGHVVAESIVGLAREQGLVLSPPQDAREFRGSGLRGTVDAVPISAGSRSLVLGDQPLPAWAEPGESRFRGQPVLRVFVSVNDRLAGILTFGDSIRGDAVKATRALRAAGLSRIVMLTGDDTGTATRLSAALGLDAVVADASPAKKVQAIEAETAMAPTMMVGDGVNDAPALAAATVGVALGARGATASSDAADVVILPNQLWPVAAAVRIAQRTRRIALQSILVGLTLATSAMAAAAFGLVEPVAGALLQELIHVAVILGALRASRDGYERRAS